MDLLTEPQAYQLARRFRSLSPDKQELARPRLEAYRDSQSAAGKPQFPTVSARRRERSLSLESRFLDGDDSFFDSIPEDRREGARSTIGRLHPEQKQRLANEHFVKEFTGKPGGYSAFRDRIGKSVFGIEGDIDDAKFHEGAKGFLEKRRDRRGLIEELSQEAGRIALTRPEVKTADFFQFMQDKEDRPGFDQSETAALVGMFREAHGQISKKLEPHRDLIRKTVTLLDQSMSNTDDGEGATPGQISNMFGDLSVEERGVVLASIQSWAQQQALTSQTEEETVLGQAGQSFERGGENLFEDALFGVARFLFVDSGDVQALAPELADEAGRSFDLTQDIRALAQGTIDPIRTLSDDYKAQLAEKGLYGLSGSIPYTVAASSGIGAIGTFFAMGEQNASQLRLENPGVDPEKLRDIGYLGAVPEVLLERLQGRVLFGKLPRLQGALGNLATKSSRGLGLRNPGAPLAILSENATEGVQDLTLSAVQDIAGALDEDIPGVDWGSEAREWAKTRPEVFVSVLPLALIGARAANPRDFNGAVIDSDKLLIAAGLSPEQAGEVMAESTQEARAEKLREVFDDRSATTEQRQEAGEAAFREAQSVHKVTRNAEASGQLPSISRSEDGYKIQSPEARETVFRTFQEADDTRREMVSDEDISFDQPVLDLVRVFEENGRNGDVFDLKEEFRTLEDEVSSGVVDEGQAYERVRILEESLGSVSVDPDLGAIAVLGKNEAEFRDGVFESTSKLFRGASVLTVIEEKAEGDVKRFVAEGRTSLARVRELLQEYEQTTGDSVLQSETDQGVIEGYSALVQGFAVATYRGENAPTQSFRGALKSLLRGYRSFFEQVFRRAAKVNKARRDGTLNTDLESFLSESVGISQDARTIRAAEATVSEVFGAEVGIPASFSIAPAEFFDRLGKSLDKKLRDPKSRRDAYEKAREKLSKVKSVKANTPGGQRESLATLQAILSAFPPEVRGRVGGFVQLADKKTSQGRLSEIERRIDQADRVFEKFLRDEYLDDARKILKKAQPKKTDSRNIRGALGSEAHAKAVLAEEVIDMKPEEVEALLGGISDKLNELDEGNSEATALIDRYEVIDTVGALAKRDAEHVKYARDWMDATFGVARERRKILDEARQEELSQKAKSLQEATGKSGATQNDAKRNGNAREVVNFLTVQQLDFKQFLERTFPGSNQAVKDGEIAQDIIVKYGHKVNSRRKEFTQKVNDIFGTKSRKQAMNKMADMMNQESKSGVFYYGAGRRKEKVPIEKVEQLVSPFSDVAKDLGYNRSEVALIREAFAEFQKKTESAQDRTKFLTVDFSTSRKTVEQNLSRMEALQDWLFLDQPGNAEQQAAKGFPEEAKGQLEKFLGKDMVELGRYMQGVLSEMQPELSKVHERIHGVGLPSLPNYFPNVMDVAKDADLLDPFSPHYGLGARDPGALKSRIRNNAEPRRQSAMHTFFGHLQQMEHYRHFAEFNRDFASAYGRPETKRAVAARHGTDHQQLLERWLSIFQNGGTLQKESATFDGRFLRSIHGRLSAGILAYRASSLAIQWTNVLSTLQRTGFTSWAGAAIRLGTNPSKLAAGLKRAWNSETISLRRDQGGGPELQAVLAARPKKTRWPHSFVEAGMQALNITDAGFLSLSGAIAYEANFQSAKKAGVSDAAAERIAVESTEQAIRDTAQPTDFVNKGLAENSATGPVKLLVYMFISDPRRKYANAQQALVKAVRNVNEGDRADAARVLPLLLLAIPAAEWATRGATSMVFKGEDEEEAFSADEFTAAMLTNQLSGIPIGGHLWEGAVRSAFLGFRFRDDSPIGAVAGGVEGGFRNAKDAVEAYQDGDLETAMKEFSRALTDVGRVSPMAGASGNILNQGIGLKKFIEDDE